MKRFYKEIIIAFLLALSLWLGFNKEPYRIGSSETICLTDTVNRYIISNEIKYFNRSQPVWLKLKDTTYIRDTIMKIVPDSVFEFVEVPFNEYSDSTFYVRTLGWLDSISINPIEKFKIVKSESKKDRLTIFFQAGMAKDFIAPSINFGYDKIQIGAGYNLQNSSLLLNFGYRLK